MQDLVHDDQEVVAAPLGVGHHELGHYRVDLVDDVHLQKLLELDLARGDDRADDLQGGRIELGVANLKVLEQDLDQAQFLEDEHESGVALNNHGQEFESEQRQRLACSENGAVIREELAQEELVQ